MIGAVLGDIAGSGWEWARKRNVPCDWEHTQLFTSNDRFTDDTVMTLATYCALKNNDLNFARYYRSFGNKYPDAGYGGLFRKWLKDYSMGAYGSFGNGSAMRVSPVADYAKTLEEAASLATLSAKCTHNHPEGIKGAVATAEAIWLAAHGESKKRIMDYIGLTHGYSLLRTLESIRKSYRWSSTCQDSVPEAMICFFESTDWESCIRNVLSLRGDTDTMAAIAGAIAESFYGKTGFDNDKILHAYLDDRLLNGVLYREW